MQKEQPSFLAKCRKGQTVRELAVTKGFQPLLGWSVATVSFSLFAFSRVACGIYLAFLWVKIRNGKFNL